MHGACGIIYLRGRNTVTTHCYVHTILRTRTQARRHTICALAQPIPRTRTRSHAHKKVGAACCPIILDYYFTLYDRLGGSLRREIVEIHERHPTPYPGRPPLQLLVNQENSLLRETIPKNVGFRAFSVIIVELHESRTCSNFTDSSIILLNSEYKAMQS